MASKKVNITNTDNKVTVTSSNNKIEVIDTNVPSVIEVTRPVTTIVEVKSQGPQGSVGIMGPSGSQGIQGTAGIDGGGVFTPIDSSLYATTSSLQITGSLNVSGSYYGDGGGLTNLAADTATNATNVYIDWDASDTILRIPMFTGTSDGHYKLKSSVNELAYYYRGSNPITGDLTANDYLLIGGGSNTAGGIFLNSTVTRNNFIYSDFGTFYIKADDQFGTENPSYPPILHLSTYSGSGGVIVLDTPKVEITSSVNISGYVRAATGSFGRIEGLSPFVVGDSVTFERPVTGSIFSGSYYGDGSNLTGVGGTAGTISGSAQVISSLPGGTTSGSIQVSHDNTTGFVANEHIDWTSDQGGTDIHSGNYTDTNTTYSITDGELSQNNFTTTLKNKLDGIEASADVTDTANVLANLPSGIISGSAQLPTGTVSGSAQIDHDSTTNFVANEHIDWTSDQGGTNIHSGNYTDTNTTYTVQDGGLTTNDFTNTLKSKLDGIEASADVTDATNVLANLPSGIISGSAQTITSLIASDLVVGSITAERYVVSSSVTHMTTSFSSGSTIFGDDILDTHQFTGSLYVSGSLYGDGSNLTGVGGTAGTVSGSVQVSHDDTTGFVANEHLDWTSNVGTIHSGNYTDTTTNTQLSAEQVEDFVGGMLGGTETGITVTYQDSTGDIDFVVATQTANDFTNTLKTKLDAIEASADVTDATNVVAALDTLGVISGSAQLPAGIISGSAQLPAGLISGSAQLPAGTVSGSAQIDHDSTTNFVANEHIDWTSDQGGTNIHSGNYTDTNTTYSVGDGGLTTNDFTNADHTKLNAIELLADVTDATNVTSAGALMDSEVTALALIKSLTAADISGSTTALSSSIASDVATNTAKVTNVSTNLTKTVSGTGFAINSSDGDNIALSLADTNNWGLMSDEMFDKLDGIEASADVTDATNVLANLPDGVISGSAQLPAGISIPDGTVSGSIQVDIHNTTGYVANEHLDWTSNVGTIHSGNYTDTTTNTQLSQEQVEDFVGGMLGGTETGITVTYQDSTGDIDFVVATQTANDFTNTLKSKLDAIEALADVTTATNVLSSLVASDLVVGTITAESYVISSSVTHMTTSFSSGSTIFGDDILDTHQMTGSLYVSGSVFFTEIDGGNF